MTKQEAIKQICEITSGSGIDRSLYPEEMEGNMAKRYWEDGLFTYGLEYGYILGLLQAHNISYEEIKNHREVKK